MVLKNCNYSLPRDAIGGVGDYWDVIFFLVELLMLQYSKAREWSWDSSGIL